MRLARYALVLSMAVLLALAGCGGTGASAVLDGSAPSAAVEEDPEPVLARAIGDLPPGKEIVWEDCESGIQGQGYSLFLHLDALAGRWPGDAPPSIVPGKMRLTGFSYEEAEVDVDSEDFREEAWNMLKASGLDKEYTPDDIAETFSTVKARIAPESDPSREDSFGFYIFRLGPNWYFYMDA